MSRPGFLLRRWLRRLRTLSSRVSRRHQILFRRWSSRPRTRSVLVPGSLTMPAAALAASLPLPCPRDHLLFLCLAPGVVCPRPPPVPLPFPRTIRPRPPPVPLPCPPGRPPETPSWSSAVPPGCQPKPVLRTPSTHPFGSVGLSWNVWNPSLEGGFCHNPSFLSQS